MNYELVYILTPKLTEADAKKKTANISSLIGKETEKIAAEDFWGKRELAYPIDKFTDGYYMVVQFSAEPSAISKIDKNLRLDEDVIRFLLIKKEALAKSKDEIKAPTKEKKEIAPKEEEKSVEPVVAKKAAKPDKPVKKSSQKAKISDLDEKLDDILEKGIKD